MKLKAPQGAFVFLGLLGIRVTGYQDRIQNEYLYFFQLAFLNTLYLRYAFNLKDFHD